MTVRSTIKATVRQDGIGKREWSNAKGSGAFDVCEVFDEDFNKVEVTLPDRSGKLSMDQVALLVPGAEVDIVVDTVGKGQFEQVTAIRVSRRHSVAAVAPLKNVS